MIYPPKNAGPIILQEARSLAKNYKNITWNVAGNMESVLMTDEVLPENLTISLGRQLLADPSTVRKLNNEEPVSFRCSGCNRCHYYSFGFDGIQPCRIAE